MSTLSFPQSLRSPYDKHVVESSPKPKQVITIRPDGSFVGLKHGAGKGLDLTTLGHSEVRRVTLIEWSDRLQLWIIRWNDRMSNAVWTRAHLNHVIGLEVAMGEGLDDSVDLVRCYVGNVPSLVETALPDGLIYFDEYEVAVQAEVAVIQYYQRQPDQKAFL